MCPKDALTDLAPMHNSLGNLYTDLKTTGQGPRTLRTSRADVEKAGNRFQAGVVRSNMAVMSAQACGKGRSAVPAAGQSAPRTGLCQGRLARLPAIPGPRGKKRGRHAESHRQHRPGPRGAAKISRNCAGGEGPVAVALPERHSPRTQPRFSHPAQRGDRVQGRPGHALLNR